MKELESIDCYDLSNGGKKKKYNSIISCAIDLKVSHRNASLSLKNGLPIKDEQYFLIKTKDCILNRDKIIANQMSYYKKHYLISKEERKKMEKGMYYKTSIGARY